MPEGRFISRSISVSEQLGNVSLEADFLFGRCIPHLDVEGRITGNPKGLKAIVCPLRDELSHQKITHLLKELDEADLLVWYEVNGLRFLEFPGFSRHQKGMKKDREATSKIPSSKVKSAQRVIAKVSDDKNVLRPNSGVDQDLVRLSKVKESKGELSTSEVKNIDAGASSSGKTESKLDILSQPHCESLRLEWSRHFGGMEYPRFRKTILPIFQVPVAERPSVADVREAIIAFREWWEEQEDKDQGFWGLEKFVSTAAKWIRFGKMPIAEGGVETERGKWAGSKRVRSEERRMRASA
jgi:hypothetical protein